MRRMAQQVWRPQLSLDAPGTADAGHRSMQ
jgi:hypothetical protein